MKVLVLAPRPLSPAYDGGTVATVRCIRGLAEAGASVTVLSMKTEKHQSGGADAPDYLFHYRSVSVKTSVRPLSLLLNLAFSRKPYDLARFISREYSEALREIISAGSFDLIHCEGLVFALYLDQIRKLTSAPVVLRAHNLEHRIREMMAAEELSPLRRFYLSNLSRRLKRLERRAAAQFDAIVPISGPDSDWFSRSASGRPVFLCETGADKASFIPEPVNIPPSVGFLGSMNWQPNLDGIRWFIESVWPLILKVMPDACLRLAGREIDAVKKSIPQAMNLSVEGEPDDARTFIASNHVMIAPLFAGSGLRIKIIEAMSAGRPVVATPVAAEGMETYAGKALTEETGETGNSAGEALTIAAYPESFSHALVRYLADPELRSSGSMAAVKLVHERFDNRTLTAGLLEFYMKLAHDS